MSLKNLTAFSKAASTEFCGVGQDRADQAAHRALSYSPSLILSTGFAGALQERIETGDLVMDQGRSDPGLIERAVRACGKTGVPCHPGAFLSSKKLIGRSEEKTKAGEETGAVAVEMESQAVFEVCRERKIPFCSFRSVSDALDQDLPELVTHLNSSGIPTPKSWVSFLGHPGQWPGFFRFVLSTRKAEKNLAAILTHFIQGAETP